MMQTLTLPNRDTTTTFRVEERLLGEVVSPRRVAVHADPEAVIRRALAAPIGARPIAETAGPESRVAVLIDDATRTTPTRLILPLVLAELRRAGVPDDAVSIVVALGTHRPMTEAEILHKVGDEIARSYRIVNDPAWDETKFRSLGVSRRGIPARVHRVVADADVRIGIGMITPHMDAGFGGGAKIVLPGVCGAATVEAFHTQMAYVEGSQLGRRDARLRLDLEAFVAEKVPLDAIVNVIVERSGAVYACVAGHPVAAHRAGADLAMEVYGAPVSRKYPVVLANAHPYGEDFWQATKALAAAELMAEPGGTVILVADCPEGFAEHPRFPEYSNLSPAAIRKLLASGAAEDPVAAGEAVVLSRFKADFRASIVSRGFTREQARAFGFAQFDTIEDALAEAIGRQARPEGCLAVLTHGGFTAPYLPEPDATPSTGPLRGADAPSR